MIFLRGLNHLAYNTEISPGEMAELAQGLPTGLWAEDLCKDKPYMHAITVRVSSRDERARQLLCITQRAEICVHRGKAQTWPVTL